MSEEIRSSYVPTKERLQLIRNKRWQFVGGMCLAAASLLPGAMAINRLDEHHQLLQDYVTTPIGNPQEQELGDRMDSETTTFPIEMALTTGTAAIAGVTGVAMTLEATRRLRLVGGFQRQPQ